MHIAALPIVFSTASRNPCIIYCAYLGFWSGFWQIAFQLSCESFACFGGNLMGNTWFIEPNESKETIYSSVQATMVLRNYPSYSSLFHELKMPEKCAMVGRIEDLMKSIDRVFSFEVEYVSPGALVDLHADDKAMYMYRYYHGHIYPRVTDGKNILKIEAVDNKLRYVDIPKALYEYGQMINYQVISLEVETGNHFHNT
jgi:hypothetical protein